MTTTSILLFIGIVIGVLLVIWLIRSRGNTQGRHVDMTLTATGAVTEAVEELVDEVKEALSADVRAGGGKASDAGAMASNAAALMANSGMAAPAMIDIGVPAAQGAPDNLRQLKGVGPKLDSVLVGLGITRFDQIAAWGPDEIAKVDAHLGTFKGRITRDNWIEQAGFLANGDIAGFEAKFGKLDGK
jgi:predicted flap endonuclease-1-like 5' DNA nuclease